MPTTARTRVRSRNGVLSAIEVSSDASAQQPVTNENTGGLEEGMGEEVGEEEDEEEPEEEEDDVLGNQSLSSSRLYSIHY